MYGSLWQHLKTVAYREFPETKCRAQSVNPIERPHLKKMTNVMSHSFVLISIFGFVCLKTQKQECIHWGNRLKLCSSTFQNSSIPTTQLVLANLLKRLNWKWWNLKELLQFHKLLKVPLFVKKWHRFPRTTLTLSIH